jgi:hypothetical protein
VNVFGFFRRQNNMGITMIIQLVDYAIMIYPFPSAQSREAFGFLLIRLFSLTLWFARLYMELLSSRDMVAWILASFQFT